MKLQIIFDDNDASNIMIKISVSRHGDFFSMGKFEIIVHFIILDMSVETTIYFFSTFFFPIRTPFSRLHHQDTEYTRLMP